MADQSRFPLEQNSIEFVVNASFPEIVSRLGQASVGLNTMMDEHFGISVVEFMVSLAGSGPPRRPYG
jgi:hypothetical protein